MLGLARDPGTGLAYDSFRVDGFFDGTRIFQQVVTPRSLAWAESGCGRYQYAADHAAGACLFWVYPGGSAFGGGFVGPAMPGAPVMFDPGLTGIGLDPLALGASAAAASVTAGARADAVLAYTASTRPVAVADGVQDGEDLGSSLLARAAATHRDHGHRNPGELPSRLVVNEALLNLQPGTVGTSSMGKDNWLVDFFALRAGCRAVLGEYDTLLKALVPIACRYADILQPRVLDHLIDTLLSLRGPHDPAAEHKEIVCEATLVYPLPFSVQFPESENHQLLIESARYLTNQLLLDRTGDHQQYDNAVNGMDEWMLRHLQVFAQHDFLEFNARPYQRYSLTALLNLEESARNLDVSAAARIVLDYAMTKFAVSSNGLRRAGPFRRLRDNADTPTPPYDDFYSNHADPLTGFFHLYTGPPPDAAGAPGNWIPEQWTQEALTAGLARYRPPFAAYQLALANDWAGQHRLYHGQRPPGWAVIGSDQPSGGVETYYRSPSFLLSSGGMFLNSGYGNDELFHYQQVAVAGSITVLPTRGNLHFADLIRLDPWPDFRNADNTAVHMGFACGANLRGVEKWCQLTGAPAAGPWFILDLSTEQAGKLGIYVAAYRTAPAEAASSPTTAGGRNRGDSCT